MSAIIYAVKAGLKTNFDAEGHDVYGIVNKETGLLAGIHMSDPDVVGSRKVARMLLKRAKRTAKLFGEDPNVYAIAALDFKQFVR